MNTTSVPLTHYAQERWGAEVENQCLPTKAEKDTVDRAVVAAAVVTGMNPGLIVGWRRMDRVCDVRFIVYELCWRTKLFSQSSLGRCFGRNHVTIRNGVGRVKERMTDKTSSFRDFQRLYAKIREKYKEYEKNPERMVQEFCLYEGRQGDDLSSEEGLR